MAGIVNEYDDILKLIQSNQNRIYFDLKLQIDIDGVLYDPIKVNYLNIREDYKEEYSQDIVCEIVFNAAQYTRFIYPARKNMKGVLTRKLMSEVTDQELSGFDSQVGIYRLVEIENRDMDIQGLPNIANEQALLTVHYALQDLTIEQMSLIRTGGIFYKTSELDVLRYLLGKFSAGVELDSKYKARGVDVIPADNRNVRENIVIPHGKELLAEIPDYLQNHCGGIYNHDINIFYKNRQWFIFPITNTKRFDKASYKAEFVFLPPNKAPWTERTYCKKENVLFVAITGKFNQFDVSDIAQLNLGNGVRFSKASALWDYATTTGNKSVVDRSSNMAEFINVSRPTRYQNLPISDRRVTDNIAREQSKISARRGFIINAVWHNSNADQLRPCMPCRLHIPYEGGSRTYEASLISVETNTVPITKEVTSQRYSTTSALTFFATF